VLERPEDADDFVATYELVNVSRVIRTVEFEPVDE